MSDDARFHYSRSLLVGTPLLHGVKIVRERASVRSNGFP
jgi:hypothetical protein